MKERIHVRIWPAGNSETQLMPFPAASPPELEAQGSSWKTDDCKSRRLRPLCLEIVSPVAFFLICLLKEVYVFLQHIQFIMDFETDF